MRTLTIKIAAGSTEELAVKGNYVRIRTAPYDLFLENPDTSEKVEGSQGDDFELSPFKRLKVTNTGGVDSVFKLTISQDKKAGSAPGVISGTVGVSSLVPTNSAGSNVNPVVTNVAAVMLAANAARKYCLIQNKDASGDIYINFGGVATVANGLRIPAGGAYELNCNMLTAAISAIGSIASNANIVIVQG